MNIIRKESVNFCYNGNVEGIAFQQEVTDWCRNILNPSIDLFLETFEGAPEVISIKNINIDINLTTADWNADLAEKILAQFKDKIHQNINNHTSESNAVGLAPGEQYYHQLVYFLQYGILPWYSAISSKTEMQVQLGNWIRSASTSSLKELVPVLKDEKPVKRLLNLVSITDAEILITAMMKAGEEDTAYMAEDINAITTHIAGEKTLQENLIKRFAEMLFPVIAPGRPSAVILTVKQWLYDVLKIYPEHFNTIRSIALQNPIIKSVVNQIVIDGPSSLQQTDERTEEPANAPLLPGTKHNKSILYEIYGDITGSDLQKELVDGVFITNAGAVIIAAFLPALFSRTGLLQENKITDVETALCLLHYCITGNTQPAEFELLLPKILCGMEPEVVAGTVVLEEKNLLKEADEMLSSVIEYWTVLRDTSPSVLRTEFLQRNGKLSFIKNEWRLQVEQKAYDVIMEQLPWNISRIRLPWMQCFLMTDWI